MGTGNDAGDASAPDSGTTVSAHCSQEDAQAARRRSEAATKRFPDPTKGSNSGGPNDGREAPRTRRRGERIRESVQARRAAHSPWRRVRGRLNLRANDMPEEMLDLREETLYAYIGTARTVERTIALGDAARQVDEVRSRWMEGPELSSWGRGVDPAGPK